MPDLHVDPAGLSAFSIACAQQAVVVRASLRPGAPGPAFQASAHAVNASDGAVAAASLAMGDRIEELSGKLSAAAARYLGRDEESSAALAETMTGSPA